MKKQSGYTLFELVFVVGFFATIALIGGLIYVGIHFLAKVW